MSNKVFDKTLTGLPDLEIKVDPEHMMEKTDDQEAGDELIVPESPTRKEYSMTTSEIFVTRQKAKKKQEGNVKLEVEEHGRLQNGITKEEIIDDLNIDMEEEKVMKTSSRGKRGNDKKPRKKRVMTEKQKENL